MRALMLIGLALATTSGLSAQANLADTWIGHAEKAWKAKKPETAADHLRCAMVYLRGVEDDARRVGLRERISKIRSSLDPLLKARSRVEKQAAKVKLDLARRYMRIQWYKTAYKLLLEAEALVPGLAKDALIEVRAKLAGSAGATILDWFKGGQEIGNLPGWTVTPNLITSPPPAGTVTALLSTKVLGAPAKVSLEFKMGTGNNGVVFMFGSQRQWQQLSFQRIQW